ncbi:Regulator of G- signaling 3 [Brachionus plicatilis]|uniref:Regulator of G-signaling 3 n=1 Tax=Brachionus plicatilis TaxID=10195 RepID=A0A3M7SAN7_BRAPC|nr:Regulator of G- signaling 3 [Brachionus plicatilis]
MNFSHLSSIYTSQCGDNDKLTLIYGDDKSANCIYANRHSTLIEHPQELENYFTINAHNSLVSYKTSNEMNAKINEQTPKMEVVHGRRDPLNFKLNTRNLLKFFSRDKKAAAAAAQWSSSTSEKAERTRSDVRVKFKQIRLRVATSEGASFGFTIHGYCPCQVGKVEKSSPSELSGLMPGDLIIKINGKNVSRATCDSVVRLIKSGADQLVLELMRPCQSSGEKKRAPTNVYESMPASSATHMSPESKKTSIITDSDYKTQSSAGTDEPANISAASCPPGAAADDHHLYLCEQLLNLEEKFIETMQKGVQQYSRPLRHCLMIDQAQHCTIFQNIEKILAISEYQLNQLISQDDSILLDMFSTIGKLYENKMRMSSEAFDIYLHGIQKALRLLDQLSGDSNLGRFLADAKDDIDMDLGTFLLVPIFYVNEIVHCLNKIKHNTLPISSDYQFLVNLTHSLEPYCRRSQLVLAAREPNELHNPLKSVHIDLDDEEFQDCEPLESDDQAKLSLLYSGCVQYRQSCNKWKRIRLLFFRDRVVLLSYNSNVDKFLGLLSKSCSNSWSVLDSLNEFTFKSISFKSVVSVHCEQAKCEFALRYSRGCTGPAKTNKIKLKCSSGDNQRWSQLFAKHLGQF